jgi:spermidine/putrescine transport system substrate-binding protein
MAVRASPRGTKIMTTRTLRRRGIAAAAILPLVALTFAACGSDDDSAEPSELDPDADLSKQTVVVTNWAGYMPPDIAEKVEKATGAKVEITEHATNEDMVAKVVGSGGEGLDVVFGSQPYLHAFAEEGLLEPLDTDYLKNWDSLDPDAQGLAEVDDQPYFAPYTWGTTGICYRSDLVDEAPTSWYDLLQPDEKYSGKVTMMGTERWAVMPAQKALGYSVNTTDEDEMEDVKELMLEAKPHLLAYDDTTFYERLISGEAVMVEAWDGWCNYGIAENPDIDFVVPEEGSDLWIDGIAILKSSENKEAAYAFVDTILDPVNHAWASENILYNVPNDEAVSLLPEELTTQYATLGTRREEMLQGENMVDIGEASTLYNRIITEVTASDE